jgi:hypothetical protein
LAGAVVARVSPPSRELEDPRPAAVARHHLARSAGAVGNLDLLLRWRGARRGLLRSATGAARDSTGRPPRTPRPIDPRDRPPGTRLSRDPSARANGRVPMSRLEALAFHARRGVPGRLWCLRMVTSHASPKLDPPRAIKSCSGSGPALGTGFKIPVLLNGVI